MKINISFFMPAYNCEEFVEESVLSIMEGNFETGDELVIVNDGSTDNTAKILQSIQDKFPVIKIINHPENKGGGAARNTAIENTKHEILFCLDSDNILVPGSILALKEFMLNTGADVAVFEKLQFFKGDYKEGLTGSWKFKTEAPITLKDVLLKEKVPGASGNYMFTKRSWIQAGKYPEFASASDTYGFGMWQLATGAKMVALPNYFYYHRQGIESYWRREKKKGALPLNYTQIILPLRPLINDEDFIYILSNTETWWDNLTKRPVRLKDGWDKLCKQMVNKNGTLQPQLSENSFLIKDNYPSKKISNNINQGEVNVIEKYIKDNSIVFDIGANLGAWSLEVMKKSANIQIHLFEASPYTYQLLLQNMANYIDAEKLFLNQFAISSQDSFQAFNFYETRPTLSGIYRRDIKLEEKLKLGVPKSISVPTITLDNYCLNMDIKRINFLKVDVEGAELDVIFGAEQLLKKGKIDYFQFEYGGTYLDAKTTLKQVFEYLQSMKYLIFKILPNKLEYKPQLLSEDENYKYSNFLAVNERFKAKVLGEKRQMLDLQALCKKHSIKVKGVIHVGAHEGKELHKYQEMGVEKVLFIEANPVVFERLKTNIAEIPNVEAVNYAISNKNGNVNLRVTSQDQSSSILPLKRHQEIYPKVTETHQATVDSITLDKLLEKLNAQPLEFNFLNIDIQGAELLALSGATNLLKHIQAINTEINYEELYEGCALIDEIDDFLENFGFERVATTTPFHPSWGDAFYVKKPTITMSTLGKNGRFGNQIFQYAFLKIYAQQHNLNIETSSWIGQYLFGHEDSPISQQLPEFKERRGRVEFSQSRVLNSPTPLINVDLWGYFQYHTSYYAQYKDYFRSLFKPLPEIETELQKAVNFLRSKGKTVVGIHLRRIKYDYAIFCTTPSDRYKEWLKEIWETLKEPVLFIASDDLDAVIDDFGEYNPVTFKDLKIELPKANYYPDFYILTQCDVLAISNSTFSFIASMLNEQAKFFCRPSLISNKIIPFDPWDSYVLLTEKKESLPDSGYKARIKTSNSLVVTTNDTFTISAQVQNISDVIWQRSCVSRIVLAYRWLDENKNVVREHDSEGNFELDLQPSEETEVSFKINAPSLEGQFILELDMLDEDIAWFKDKGSETTKVNVLVEPTTKVVEVEQKWKLKTPVAFLIYKRPDVTEKVFETIRQAKPPKLLVIADGPKADVSGEAEKCAATRTIIDKVDWDCEVITNYSDVNLGCRQRVSSGLDWVFEQVEEAIILEEDCLPHPTFFRFCEELLERYRHDDRVMTISGTNLQFENQATEHSYYFSRYNHCWGWATWRRVWHLNNVNMKRYREIKNTNWLECLLQDKHLVERWSKVFQRSYNGEIDSWNYPFRFALWINNGLSIIPKVNLVSNIGFREDALHTRNPNHKFSNIPTAAIAYPLIHPDVIIRNTKADEFEDLEFHAPREPKQLAILPNIQPNFDTKILAVKQHFLGQTTAVNIQANWQLKTPVVFLICKRPDTTEKVFAAIREAKPPKPFVIADGPKKDKPGEVEKCAATRAIIDNVDWECEVITNYGEENWGGRRRISNGLDWVFEQVEEAIILEDDCVPHPTFFRFCEELLERYRHDDRIVMIGGTNRMFGHLYAEHSYYFSRYYCIWGWATWRRAWRLYDVNLEPWSELKDTNWLEYLLKDSHLAAYWSTKIFQKIYDGVVDTWDYRLKFAFWVHNGLSVIPNVNLVSNIGWGHPDATHTRNPNHKVANIPTEAMIYPLIHAPEITRNMKADKFEEIILCPTKASRRLDLLQNLKPNFDVNKFGFKPHFLGKYEEENKRYLQTESLGLKESILIVTSIAPGNTEKQQAAIQSWYDLGFSVVSLNIESEAKQLQPIYENVDFCIVKRDGNDLYGKPYVYINDLLDYLSEYGATIGGIINSDIHLRADNNFASFIFEQTQDSMVFASRLDVESLEATEGKIYQYGFDVFFFDKNLLKDFPVAELCLGVPCWDLWIPLIAVQKNWKLKYLRDTVAVHVDHDKNWSQENWFKAWLNFSEFQVPSAEKIIEMWKSDRKNELRETIGKEIAPSIRKAIYGHAELISCERYSIAHIINPVLVNESSDLHIAQPITFATMKTAQQTASGKVNVTLYTAQYPEDRAIIPEGFIQTPDLDRSILDIDQFQIPRKLPLIKDILDRLYQVAVDADYLIYTNVDIALQPNFYTEVAKIIEQGYDAFVINRRTIPDKYKDISEIPQMLQEAGKSHIGHDCFVLKRSLYPKFVLNSHCIGIPACFVAVLLNCVSHAEKFQEFTDLHLTFHIGEDKVWKREEYADYRLHNNNQMQILFDRYHQQGILPNSPLVSQFFKQYMKSEKSEKSNKQNPEIIDKSLATNPFDIFDQIYCLNLPRSKDRREYMEQEIARVGITKYLFFEAIDKDSDLVKKAFAEDFVLEFPPCFRCGHRKCNCENNVLISPQVANFLSFQKLWQDIVNNDYSYCLIFEDDIKFTDYCQEVIHKVFKLEFLQQYGFTKNSESLLRLGWGESEDHTNVNIDDIKLFPNLLRMSNPCYMITLGMAKKLLSSLKKISTTSDVYIHNWIGQTVNNYTLIPPIVHDLSTSRGDFKSLIHPKQNHIDILKTSSLASAELITKAEQEFDRHFKRKLVRDILVIGHPRCGSKYMSELLQVIGLDIGHESMGDQGISSWMFSVYDQNNPWAKDKYAMSRFYTDFDFLIQYVRNPRTAIPYILVENQYAPDSFEFRKRHIKQCFNEDISLYQIDVEKAIISLIRWNQIIYNQKPNLIVKIESCETDILGFCQSNNLVSQDLSIDNLVLPTKDVNSDKPYQGKIHEKPKFTEEMWNKVKLDLKKELNQFCQVYGYPRLYDDNWQYLTLEESMTEENSGTNQIINKNNPPKYSLFKAEIIAPETLAELPGEKVEIQVTVKNISTATWLTHHVSQIKLGNHWLNDKGEKIQNDDARTGLTQVLKPTESIELPLTITIPETPGNYLLELDMVQEGVAWFQDKGSQTRRVKVEVNSASKTSSLLPELPTNSSWENYYQLAEKFYQQKDFNSAMTAYQKVIEINPQHSWSYHKLANIFREQNKDDQAVTAYRQAIEINPNFSWSYYHLATILEKQGKLEEAKASYQKAIELYPNFSAFCYTALFRSMN